MLWEPGVSERDGSLLIAHDMAQEGSAQHVALLVCTPTRRDSCILCTNHTCTCLLRTVAVGYQQLVHVLCSLQAMLWQGMVVFGGTRLRRGTGHCHCVNGACAEHTLQAISPVWQGLLSLLLQFNGS